MDFTNSEMLDMQQVYFLNNRSSLRARNACSRKYPNRRTPNEKTFVRGTLKIAEVESRFEDIDNFVKGLQQFGFRNVWRDLSHNLFYFLDFTKVNNVKSRRKLPMLSLLPCLYKKR